MKTIMFRLWSLAGANRFFLSSVASQSYCHPISTFSQPGTGTLEKSRLNNKGLKRCFSSALRGNLTENLVTFVERELTYGEKLLWSGKAGEGIRLRGSDAFVIPFSLLWCGFALLFEWMFICTRAPLFMKLLGIPFVLYGLHLVFGRFIADALARAKTFYAVTNKRIFILSGFFSQEIRSLNLQMLRDVSLTEDRDGSGTITFGSASPKRRSMLAGSWPGGCGTALPAFDMIDGANRVYAIIRLAQTSEEARVVPMKA